MSHLPRAPHWLLAPVLLGPVGLATGQPWPQFARSPSRVSAADALPASLGSPRWIRTIDSTGTPIAWAPQSGLIADRTRAFALGKVGPQWKLFALSADTGALRWASPIPAPYLDSWSTPALDAANQTILVASGRYLTAIDSSTGAQRWQATLDRSVVNASPLLIADPPAARAFITDYDGFGGASRLYCINLDPSSPANPHQPGDIVWSVPIGGSAGNSPASANGAVFVAAVTDESGLSPGRILAFPVAAASPPPPLWTFTNPASLGFFGGVAVSGGALYAASYSFSGGQFAANLVKLDAATGALLWSVPCNRTNATPLPLPGGGSGGLILLSGGIRGYGSAPSIELFQDTGPSATLLWDSALDTWNDANNNTALDPGEYLAIGNWTYQPIAVAPPPAPARLLAGTPPASGGSFSPNTDLYLLDLTHAPHDPAFILDHTPGPGGTPAAAFGSIYSAGAGGLYAFGPVPCYPNCDLSTAPPALNVADFTCFLTRFAAADPYANCDASTTAPVLNVADFTCFLTRFAGGCP